MRTRCLVMPHEVDDGPSNMALDEALLEEVAGRPAAACFRTYGWSRPVLTLGYFQRLAAARADPRWGDVPLVRRATGGGAIWHDREVTYAVVVPRDHPLARPATALYEAVHRAIVALLRAGGADARRRREVEPPAAPAGVDDRPFLCFLDRDPEDVVVGGRKVVGGAQRRRAGAILQHGSLLLRRAALTPELPGIADLADVDDRPDPWANLLAEAVPRALGLEAEPSEIPIAVREQARTLAGSTYRRAAWTSRR